MKLTIAREGHTYAYSEAELRRDNPSVSFPKSLAGVDLSAFGVTVEPDDVLPTKAPAAVEHEAITMPQFLWALRVKGLRIQFERMVMDCAGWHRDYWKTAHVVTRTHSCVQAFAQQFQLSRADLVELFNIGGNVEQ